MHVITEEVMSVLHVCIIVFSPTWNVPNVGSQVPGLHVCVVKAPGTGELQGSADTVIELPPPVKYADA